MALPLALPALGKAGAAALPWAGRALGKVGKSAMKRPGTASLIGAGTVMGLPPTVDSYRQMLLGDPMEGMNEEIMRQERLSMTGTADDNWRLYQGEREQTDLSSLLDMMESFGRSRPNVARHQMEVAQSQELAGIVADQDRERLARFSASARYSPEEVMAYMGYV